MNICAISDMHGNLPVIPPGVDLLLIAGDICPTDSHKWEFQENWLDVNFRIWLNHLSVGRVVGIAGNHDKIFQEKPHRIPRGLNWTYLQDEWVTINGLRIYGTPWQPIFHWWAFNADESDLAKHFAKIPDDTDILISHGPPQGILDHVTRDSRGGGSSSLLDRVRTVKPKLHVFGHIHEGRGCVKDGDTIFANVTILNDRYEPVFSPMVFDIEAGRIVEEVAGGG